MVDRIATVSAYQSVLTDLQAAETRQAKAQAQISSGKIANDLSGFGNHAQALTATQTIKARVDGMVDQLNQTGVKMTFQQTALEQVSSIAQQVQLQLTNAIGVGTGDSLMANLQSLFSQAADAINTQYNGDYMFAGGQTDTKPFTATTMADLTTQPVSNFFQDGTQISTSRVDDATAVQTGFLATNVGKSLMTVFQSIQAFQQTPAGNFNGPITAAQQAFIDTAMTQISAVVGSTNQTAAEGGNAQNQISTALSQQKDRQTTITGVLGDLSNADVATAATNLAQAQAAVQASAQVFNALKSMSLLNYLSGNGVA